VAETLHYADIDDIIDRLDELSREKDALPEGDGDSQDDVAAAQETLTLLLVHLARNDPQDLANRRTGRHALTQQHLSIALQELQSPKSGH
jgi:hypothetical protein